jgi:TonB family protein
MNAKRLSTFLVVYSIVVGGINVGIFQPDGGALGLQRATTAAQKPPPLNLDQIKALLPIAPDAVVAGEIRDRGVSFTVKEATVAELKQLGAGPQTSDALRALIQPNRSPTVTLKSDKTQLREGETATLEVEASDPDGDQLQYRWSSSAGTIEGNGSKARLLTSGLAMTSNRLDVKVSVAVEDGNGATETKSVDLVVERVNRPPTLAVKAERNEVQQGDPLSLSAEATDPDGDQLRYRWSTSAGVIEGEGRQVKLNTSGITLNSNPLAVKVTATVEDGRGGTVTESVTVSLVEPPPPPPETYVPAVAITRVEPTFPQIARIARIAGRVVVEATINENGDVVAARAVEGPPMLHQAAVDTMKKWKFHPATRGGKPISETQKFAFDFKL